VSYETIPSPRGPTVSEEIKAESLHQQIISNKSCELTGTTTTAS
jgi:hypothetical protein